VIFIAYTIGDPWAVMIHLKDALIASTAMVSPFWFPETAGFADIIVVGWSVYRHVPRRIAILYSCAFVITEK